MRAVFVPLGRYLAQFADGAAPPAALDTVRAAQKKYWTIFWEQPEIADSLLTSSQRHMMPPLEDMLRVPKSGRDRARWYFGSHVPLVEPKRGAAPRP